MGIAKPLMKHEYFDTRTIKPGLPAPEGFTFESNGDESEALAELEQAINRLKNHNGPLELHPFFGHLTNEQWHQFHTIHSNHHLTLLVPMSS